MNKRGIATALILAIIFGLTTVSLGTYIVYDNVKTGDSSTSTTTKSSKITNQNGETVIKENSDKELVYDLVNEENKKLPYINIDSPYVKMVNNEIKNSLNTRFATSKTENGETYSTGIEKIDYVFYNSNNVLSVIIKEYSPSDYIQHEIYNININTGESISNLEILNSKSLTIEQFNKIAKEKVSVRVEEASGAPATSEENAISIDNNFFDNNMFIDNNRKINVIAKIRYSAGGLGLHEEAIIVE